MSDFVAEIKPRSFHSQGQNFFHGKDDFVAEIRSKSSRQTTTHQTLDQGVSCDASDSYLQQMLSDMKFSRQGLINLLEQSVLTLVEKLLTGRNICTIEGALCISFHGNECPLIVNLQKKFPEISNACQTEHMLLEKRQPELVPLEKRQPELVLLEKRQTELGLLEKRQTELGLLEKRQTELGLLEKRQPERVLLEDCLNVKVKARESADLSVTCDNHGMSCSPGYEFDRDPCRSPTEIDCSLSAPSTSQDERASCVPSCIPSNHPPSPVSNSISSTTPDANLSSITRGGSSASSSPKPDGDNNEIQLRKAVNNSPTNRDSDGDSGYLSNEKEDSDIASDNSKEDDNKCNEKSEEDYNDYFCSGFDGPSTRYISEESPASVDSFSKLDSDSYGSSADGSDEVDEDGDEDGEHRLVIDENTVNDLKIAKMNEKFEKHGHAEKCCQSLENKTDVNDLMDINSVQKLDEDEEEDCMSVESEEVESTFCLDVANTKPNTELPGNSRFNWIHVQGMPHPQSIMSNHLRRLLNKPCLPVLPATTSASLQEQPEPDLHVCSYCCRHFTAKNNLKRHMRRHTGQRPYKCSNCPLSFLRRDELKGHMIRHEYNKPFRCSLCQKGYTDRACIKNHMAKEHKSRLMHVCPQCGESFDCEEAFTCHKGTHPELKPFACTTCSFVGTSNLMLLKHNLLHSHKLFSCKPCNAHFADPFHYTSHVRKHKKMNSFKHYMCCFCDTILGTYEQFVRHEYSHSQSKIRACSVCKKQFRSKVLLQDHLMTHQQPDQPMTEHHIPKTVDAERTKWSDERKHFLHADMNFQPEPIDFTRHRSDCVVEDTPAEATPVENDEFYGQLLDLSMKKSSPKLINDSCNSSDKSQTGSYDTSVRATGTSVNDGSRNGASSSDPARLSRECGLKPPGFAPDHSLKTAPRDDTYKPMLNNFTNITRSSELGIYRSNLSPASDDKHTPFVDMAGSYGLSEPLFTRRSRFAERTHHISGVSNAASDKKLWSRTACSQPSGRPPLMFSPYNREKMADLAAKFMVARGSKLVGEKGKVKLIVAAPEEEKKVGDVRQQSNAQKKEPLLLKGAGASPMKTEGSCKNALLDLTGQAHQENDTVVSEYSNLETTLSCHIPTVVKSKPLTEQNANADSPLDFRYRALKAFDSEGQCLVGGSHSCDMCREAFGTFLELEDHSVEVHKRYLCEHCKKGFTARPNRDRHVRYHTGERPYKCDLCDLAFFRGDDLKYHRTTRHPTAQPFVCPRCSANFTWGRDLEKHIRHSRCKV